MDVQTVSLSQAPHEAVCHDLKQERGGLVRAIPVKARPLLPERKHSHCSLWHQAAVHLGNNYPIPCWVYILFHLF